MEKIECGLGVILIPKVTTRMGLDYSDYKIENSSQGCLNLNLKEGNQNG